MRVAIVAGGPSSEAEVSRASAAGVAQALDSAGHETRIVELGPELPGELARFAAEVVFPATHGALGEDGCLQGLLEVLQLPYVGSGVLASALAADKPATKLVLSTRGLPTALGTVVRRMPPESEWAAELDRVRQELGGRAFVIKPAGGGSAIGVSILDETAGPSQFGDAVRTVFELDEVAVIEAFWRGAEVTCGVLENERGEPEALPPTLIRAKASTWYDFRAKYGSGGSEHVCPAPFDSELTTRIQEAAVQAHRALGARDLSRTDFIVAESGAFVLLEVNTLPGMTKTSLFPEAARARGIEFPELCDRLVRRAAGRPERRALQGVPLPE